MEKFLSNSRNVDIQLKITAIFTVIFLLMHLNTNAQCSGTTANYDVMNNQTWNSSTIPSGWNHGNIIVHGGATLILDNVTLSFQSGYSIYNTSTVSQSNLKVINGSVLQACSGD
jgi:Fe-S cluster assembly iron-binding protein IscA